MKIALFNVRYSPNLGDGILSFCLESELKRCGDDVHVVCHDLAGRTGFGQGAGKRKLAIKLLGRLPLKLRHAAIEALLGRQVRELKPRWQEALKDVDLVLLGGGNLISDIDLNFPLKIGALCDEVERAKKSLVLMAVGVADNWTNRGAALFRNAFTRAKPAIVFVRDKISKEIWDRRLQADGAVAARICPDPAVLAFRHLPAPLKTAGVRPVLGINVIAPIEIELHAGSTGDQKSLVSWLSELAEIALSDGYDVTVFSNGNLQDDDTVRLMERSWKGPGRRPTFLPRPSAPQELAAMIAGCDLVAGHRLHLHIPAFSYRIPSVGFLWDEKLRGFFISVGRERFLLNMTQEEPRTAWSLLQEAKAEGVSDSMWNQTVDAASAAVGEAISSYRWNGLEESRSPVNA